MPRAAPAATWAVRTVAIQPRSNWGTSHRAPRTALLAGRSTLG
jgi:hypothetical protein